MVARQDYLPFGEEIPAGYAGRSSSLLFGASDGVEQKFTGQIRDSETGMDFFPKRYYASAVGRFTSPDPMNLGADPTDPQSWNAYAYVRNNPLALVDPMGLCHMGADNVAYDDEPGDCGGGSVTVVAQAPPDVMPIFVSLPSLLSDNQQPMPTAPPAVTEAAKHPKSGTCSSTTWLPQGGGIAYGVSGDAGVGLAGVTSTGSAGFGVFHDGNTGTSAGAFATYGGAAYAGTHVASTPKQTSQPFSFLAYAGAGLSFFLTNAHSVQQIRGRFRTATINVGVGAVTGAVQLSWGGGI